MSLDFFKPTKSVKGALISVNFSAKADKVTEGKVEKGDRSFYVNLVAQTGWDNERGNGSFKDGKKITVKFAPHEIAGMLSAIKKNITLAEAMGVQYVYHDGEKTATTINFGPHFKKVQKDGQWIDSGNQVGFALRVTKTDKVNKDNKDSLGIGLTWAETELFSLFLQDGLVHIFSALYASSINKFKEQKPKVEEPAKELSVKEPKEGNIELDEVF